MLKDKSIDFLYISHEHFDHFWGIEAVLKYYPDIKIIVPKTFTPDAFEFIKLGKHYSDLASNLVKNIEPMSIFWFIVSLNT